MSMVTDMMEYILLQTYAGITFMVESLLAKLLYVICSSPPTPVKKDGNFHVFFTSSQYSYLSFAGNSLYMKENSVSSVVAKYDCPTSHALSGNIMMHRY